MPKLECILAFLRPVNILLQYINMVIDQLAAATLLNGCSWVNYLLDAKCLTVAEGEDGTAWMKHLIYKGWINE